MGATDHLGGGRVIRVELGSEGLGRTRFAMSPLGVTADLLFSLGKNTQSADPAWQTLAVRTLRDRRLGLLAALGSGGGPQGYAPDFLRPEPDGSQFCLDRALHAVASTSGERIGFEMGIAANGHDGGGDVLGRLPRPVQSVLERGEDHLAQTAADQLAQFWKLVIEPGWPQLRARLADDLAARSTTVLGHGVIHAIDGLAANVSWREGGLDFQSAVRGLTIEARGAVLVPSVFASRATIVCGDPGSRTPSIIYPVSAPARISARLTEELIGDTRARLLAALGQPRTTGELAERLHLSRATISYHLQILLRTGLLRRTRDSRHVFYSRAN